jgi:hypothetical protein
MPCKNEYFVQSCDGCKNINIWLSKSKYIKNEKRCIRCRKDSRWSKHEGAMVLLEIAMFPRVYKSTQHPQPKPKIIIAPQPKLISPLPLFLHSAYNQRPRTMLSDEAVIKAKILANNFLLKCRL